LSGKSESRKPVAPKPKIDRRVRRTRDALGDALLALIQEKPFATITVQHVLNRAGIGRSTFYAHYRGKDDLLLSDMEDFLEGISTLLSRRREASNRVAPVQELFAHVAEMRHLVAALNAADKMRDFLEMAQGYFARAIEQRFRELRSLRGIATSRTAATSYALAGALLSLMSWWLDHDTSASPEQMDALFHQIVWSGVEVRSTIALRSVI
jgi:AcrR family transcriptional regulator